MSTENSKQKILIVDDMPLNIKILRESLRNKYNIFIATRGEKALAIAASERPPDLILLDIMMPEMDGYEVCKKLKEDERTQSIPVIFISGKGEVEDETKGLELGAVDYITKPFSIPIVKARLRTHLQLLESKRQLETQNQTLVKLNDLKNRFLGMAAHDLRNPLDSIRGFCEMMLDVETEMDKEEKQECLETIYQVNGQMLYLINDLLDVSVIESGKFDLILKAGRLGKIVGKRVQLMAINAKAKKIRITKDINDVNETLFDSERIAQVIDNLLSNAVKFSQPDTTICVKVEEQDRTVKIHIQDQGPGIPPQEIGKLFKAFQKLSVQPTAGEKSTGLGMSIVKRIVDAHSGEISVESKVGVGTTFTVSLPMRVNS